ncbi:MAG: hypothetical protein IKA63_00325 [Clostridia bacterium]|nr:hypothetical protein [Clostridia bacterium]
MDTIASISRVLAWVTLVITTAFQCLAMYGIYTGNSEFSIFPMAVATVLMAVSVILFFALRQGKTVPFLMAVGAAVLFIVVAVMIKNEFTVHMGADGTDMGITSWRMVYRHLSPVLVPVFLLAPWVVYRVDRKVEKEYAKKEQPDSYLDLGDFQLSRLEEQEEPAPAKRSVRDRLRKSR